MKPKERAEKILLVKFSFPFHAKEFKRMLTCRRDHAVLCRGLRVSLDVGEKPGYERNAGGCRDVADEMSHS